MKFSLNRKEQGARYDKLDPFKKDLVNKKRLNTFGNIAVKKPKKDDSATRSYDYSSKENREATVKWLAGEAKNERIKQETVWDRYDNYYNFKHDSAMQLAEFMEEQNLPWVPAVVPDPFVQVESQIDPMVPTFEFNGRDDDKDNKKAKSREYTVKYICENNMTDGSVSRTDRRALKYGDSFYKLYWDKNKFMGRHRGDINVTDIGIRELYVDPTAMFLQDAQYINHVYSIHKNEFYRIYHDEINKSGLELDEFVGHIDIVDDERDFKDDLVQITEHWFRQPYDGDNYESGDVAVVIMAGGHELKYIEKYWLKTGLQNKNFPFVHIWRIQDENCFYNKSELFGIMDLVDAADREFAYSQVNDAFTANDVVLCETSALKEGEEFTNAPGQVVMINPGMINSVRRLQGISSADKMAATISFIQGQIDRSTRNYESNMGRETSKVTTASGLAQLRADAGSQSDIKSADRLSGYRRLFEMMDWFALEFYDDNREIYIGAKRRDEEDVSFVFNANDVMAKKEAIQDPITGDLISEGEQYFPIVDVTINVGGGAIKNPAVSLSALDRFSATAVTKENYKILSAALDILDIPQRQDIIKTWEETFGIDEEISQTLISLPELQGSVKKFLEEKLIQMQTDSIINKNTMDMEQRLQQPQSGAMNIDGSNGLGIGEIPLTTNPYIEEV